MAKISITWIVKNPKGHVKGPYTTIEVLNFISSGAFSGEEQISKYPGGDWTTISKEPEFYERILETLENQLKDPKDQKEKTANKQANPKVEEKKPDLDKTVAASKEPKSIIKPIIFLSPPVATTPKTTPEQVKKFLKQNKPEVIELKNIDHEKKQENLDTIRWPIFVVILLAAASMVYFGFYGDEQPEVSDKIVLVFPKQSKDILKAAEIDSRVNKALQLISQDSAESYLEAQNILVSTIENSIKNLKPRMILCAVYKELWPFSRQNESDQNAVSQLAKQTKSLNKIDPSGMLCESVKLLIEGRQVEAQSIVDKAMEKDFTNFFLYQIKGEILEHDNQKLVAESFYQKARELSGFWVKPIFSQASINAKMNESNKASWKS